jgi:hypothetical protein
MKDKCSMLDSFAVGDQVNVNFNITGKPYEKDGKTIYFTNLNAWKVSKLGGSNAPAPGNAPAESNDDLPF